MLTATPEDPEDARDENGDPYIWQYYWECLGYCVGSDTAPCTPTTAKPDGRACQMLPATSSTRALISPRHVIDRRFEPGAPRHRQKLALSSIRMLDPCQSVDMNDNL